MNFTEIAETRQSCRSFVPDQPVEPEKLEAILHAAQLAPSACNGQPYHFTVCTGKCRDSVAAAVSGMGMNRFAAQAPVLIAVSEMPYTRSAALGSRLKGIDYRSMDIGIAAAYLTAEAAAQGLGSCILGWLDSDKVCAACHLDAPVRLVIALGYAADQTVRAKTRKPIGDLVTFMD